MDFGLHLPQEKPCSTEQYPLAQVSEAEKGFFCPRWMLPHAGKERKWTSETLAVILSLFFACTTKCPQWGGNTLGLPRSMAEQEAHAASSLICAVLRMLAAHFVQFLLVLFLYFGNSIFSLPDRFSLGDTLVSITFEVPGDWGGLSAALRHALTSFSDWLSQHLRLCEGHFQSFQVSDRQKWDILQSDHYTRVARAPHMWFEPRTGVGNE